MTQLPSDHKETEPIARFRSQFIRRPEFIHLNNAGQSPMCRPARDQLIGWTERFADEGAHVFPPLFAAFRQSRVDVARFLGGSENELIFSQSVATALSQIAFGLSLKAGDEVIVWDQEYPSNFYPWKVATERAGAKLVVAQSEADLSTPLSTLERLITPRTRVIASSWVQYRTGAMLDLAALSQLARERGIFTCVDVIQGAGVLPLNFSAIGLDAVCGASHKWMCSTHGPGFLLLRAEHFETLAPLAIGAMTYGTTEELSRLDAKMSSGPTRFEPGSLPFVAAIALAASANLMHETGVSAIAQEAEWLSRRLVHGLRERGYVVHLSNGPHVRGTIVNFSAGPASALKTQEEIAAHLARAGVTFSLRPPGIRLSVHAHNNINDIDTVLRHLNRE